MPKEEQFIFKSFGFFRKRKDTILYNIIGLPGYLHIITFFLTSARVCSNFSINSFSLWYVILKTCSGFLPFICLAISIDSSPEIDFLTVANRDQSWTGCFPHFGQRYNSGVRSQLHRLPDPTYPAFASSFTASSWIPSIGPYSDDLSTASKMWPLSNTNPQWGQASGKSAGSTTPITLIKGLVRAATRSTHVNCRRLL